MTFEVNIATNTSSSALHSTPSKKKSAISRRFAISWSLRESRYIYRLLGRRIKTPKLINIYARLLRMSICRNFTARFRTLHRCQRLLSQHCRVSWEDGPLCQVVSTVNFKLPNFHLHAESGYEIGPSKHDVLELYVRILCSRNFIVP